MLKKLAHVSLAVANLDRAIEFYRDVFHAEITGREIVEDQKTEVAFLKLGGTAHVELIAPTSEDSPVARYLAKHGPGIHHICFEVDNLEANLEHLTEHGIRLIGNKPKEGAGGHKVAFLHPASTLGALIELSEPRT